MKCAAVKKLVKVCGSFMSSRNKVSNMSTGVKLRDVLGNMLVQGNLIECWLAAYPVGAPDKIIYQPYVFFTDKEYSQDELTEIMKTIHQKFVLDEETGYMKVDFRDLNRQLNKHGIGHFGTLRRYYFDVTD